MTRHGAEDGQSPARLDTGQLPSLGRREIVPRPVALSGVVTPPPRRNLEAQIHGNGIVY